MPDFFSRIVEWIDHNRYLFIGLALFAALLFWGVGCESTTTFKGSQVDRTQLLQNFEEQWGSLVSERTRIENEMQALVRAGEIAEADLDRQDENRAMIFATAGELITGLATGAFNPAALATGAVTILGILGGGGALLDNRRKDKRIRDLENGATPA